MMIVMLAAGIVCLVAGLLAIGLGSPIYEFSFGNTLILSGALTACTGVIVLSMWAAVKELKTIALRTGSGAALDAAAQPAGTATALAVEHGGLNPDGGTRDAQADVAENSAQASAPPTVPWQDDAATRDRSRSDASQESPAVAKPRRNLMFSSISRRERERAQARGSDAPAMEPQLNPPPVPPAESNGAQPPSFDDAWPRSERSRSADPAQRRAGRGPSTVSEPPAARQPPSASAEDQPAVTVLKSGVVDGMAYSLYSDGSIEAQMPEGMMRFASIDELRAHLGQRP